MACVTSQGVGSPWAFAAAAGLVIAWALTGPLFHYSEVWQLVINTGTTIITFLMVFLIQATQNRDSRALHLKLDELIRTSDARDAFTGLEDASDTELRQLHDEFKALRRKGLDPRDAFVEAHHQVRLSRPPEERDSQTPDRTEQTIS